MVRELERELKAVGLTLNGAKTLGMRTRNDGRDIVVGGEKVKWVQKCIYLGQEFTMEPNRFGGEIGRRVRSASFAYSNYKQLFKKRSCPMHLKKRLFYGVVLPAMLYGCETWALNQAQKQKLSVSQRRMERSMLGITILDRWTNDRVRQETGLKDVVGVAGHRKWKWCGRLAGLPYSRWSRVMTEWTPHGPKRRPGRPVLRWRDPITKEAGKTFFTTAQHPNWNLSLPAQRYYTIC